MKTNFKTVFAIALIAFLATGCGKKKSGGSSCDINNPYTASLCSPYQNLYSTGNLLNTGLQNQQVTQEFFAWLNAVEDKQIAGSVNVTYKQTSGQSCTSFLGIPLCASTSSQPTYVNQVITVPANQTRLSYAGLSGLSGAINTITRDPYHANIYEVYVGSGAQTVRYIIDTNLHAALNPRLYQNYDNGVIRELVSQ
jgi:hypothetical protein